MGTRGVTWLGTPTFPEAARHALADTQLRANLHRATSTIRTKRAATVAELPDWERLRHAGEAIKDDVLAHLDTYLGRLEEAVTARGGVVHWARDAAEANAIVLDLAREAGTDEVVKVKSLATDEIELNEALAAGGVHAVETDLAELIVQLGQDRPSHILVPAIHRNRAEIRDLFRRQMPREALAPADLSDDPRALADAARTHLRRKFLSARVAVSGANFAVADTGSIVVVESEGNGRMCLTLPQTLITVMGIEKLVPTWRDLEVFLQLLPRSSTAERMNPYTSIWSGVAPGDGPQHFHLVLLDNGRTDTLADSIGRQALRCIRCSACLNVCPVYERTGGQAYGSVYPGPIGAILSPQLLADFSDEQAASLPYASSLCGACFEVCPVRIDIPEVLVHLRGKAVEAKGSRSAEALAMGALAWIIADPRRPPSGWPGCWVAWPARRAAMAPSVDCRGPGRGGRRLGTRRRRRASRSGPGGGAPVAGDPTTDPTARSEVLGRVRAALADRPAPQPVRRDYDTFRTADDPARFFAERVTDYRATVTRVDAAGLPAAIDSALRDRGARALAGPPDLPVDWRVPGAAWHLDDPPLTVERLDGCDGAVTGCAVAIAETGTIVLDAGPAQGRRALSLVPDYHLCVVRADQVVVSVPEALARLDPLRPLTFISGPSATSDIELDRVEGVHGPRTLDVVLVGQESPATGNRAQYPHPPRP